jgi:hypothetical protein
MLATVTHPIVGGKPSEVEVHIHGGTETYMAYADTNVAVQTQVMVIGQPSARASDAVMTEACFRTEARPRG